MRHLKDMTDADVAATLLELTRVLIDERYSMALKLYLAAKQLHQIDVDDDAGQLGNENT